MQVRVKLVQQIARITTASETLLTPVVPFVTTCFVQRAIILLQVTTPNA